MSSQKEQADSENKNPTFSMDSAEANATLEWLCQSWGKYHDEITRFLFKDVEMVIEKDSDEEYVIRDVKNGRFYRQGLSTTALIEGMASLISELSESNNRLNKTIEKIPEEPHNPEHDEE